MIKTTVKENGFEGILLPGDGRKSKVVIVMSGSNGGMNLTKQCAELMKNELLEWAKNVW